MLEAFFSPAIRLMGRLSYLYKTLLLLVMIIVILAGTFVLVQYGAPTNALEVLATDVLLLLFALWLYLFVGSYLGIKEAITYLAHLSDTVSQGDLIPYEPLQSRDEFGQISHAMNRMIGTMQQNLMMLREYQKAVDSGALVNKTDAEGRITYVNSAYEKLSGYTLAELQGQTYHRLRSPNTTDLQIQILWDTLHAGEFYRGIFENIAKNGSSFFVKITIIPIFDRYGSVTEYLAIMSDITALKAHEKMLESQLYTDDLTGLPNRNAFHRYVSGLRDPKMMLLNIDGFSTFNTIYGEAVGDELIIQLGSRLDAMIRGSSLRLYRMAADEYAVVAGVEVEETHFHEDVVMLAHSLNPLHLHCAGHEMRLRISVGAVIASRNDGKRPLVAMANIALREAKRRPQRSYYFYSEIADASSRLEQNLATIERLDYAIKNETVVCHFQPIYNVKTGHVTKYESLMRLIDRDGRMHMPSDFIDVAKGTHLYAHLTTQVVLNTLAMASLYPDLFFTINIDIEDIEDVRTSAFILDHLRESTCAERITFELVESKALEDNEIVESFIRRLKGMGCKIAIDDFGSGYSNYGYLLKLGVDLIKIDGSLIQDAHNDRNKRRIVASIIDICHELGMQTVTEYVHNKDVFDVVVELGTDFIQGSYIAPAAEHLYIHDDEIA